MPSPRDIAERTSQGASVSTYTPDIGPEQDCEYTQGGAPAGRYFGSDWPVESAPGGPPARYNGFRPSDYTHPLPAQGSSEGVSKAPKGNPGY